MTPQAERIFQHLIRAGSITNVEANAVHRCRSVSRRITEIARAKEAEGYRIDKVTRKDVSGQRYTRYFLIKEAC